MTQFLGLLRSSWDKLIVILIMLGVTGLSWALITGFDEPPDIEVQDVSAVAAAKAYDETAYIALLDVVKQPPQMPVDYDQHRVFISSEYVTCVNPTCQRPIPYDDLRCPHCGAPQPQHERRTGDRDRDGIPDEWEIKHGLDPFNPNDAFADFDGDGYTNLEEYLWDTDPNDPASSPPRGAKLRWVTIVREPFLLRFKGVSQLPGGVLSFQVNLGDLGQTRFGKEGDVVQGYRFVSYDERITETETGEKIDESILTVQSVENPDEVYRLVKGRVIQKEEFSARVILTIPPYRQYPRMKINDEIMIGAEKYRIVDMTGASVTIKDLQSGKEVEMPQWRPQPVPGQPGVAPGVTGMPMGRGMR